MTIEKNPYASPQSEHKEAPSSRSSFYVVAINKFTILFFSTFGLYSVYWFYENWRGYREASNKKIWPVWRAIFNIFFVHSLFSKIQEKLDEKRVGFQWRHGLLATVYVILTFISTILDRMSMKEIWSPYSDLLSLFILLPLFYTVLIAQKAVNFAESDAFGASNNTFTWANYIWIFLGSALWVLSILGLIVITGVINIDALV